MAPGGVGWRLLDVVVGQTPPLIEFGWEFRVNLQVRTRSARIPGPSGPDPDTGRHAELLTPRRAASFSFRMGGRHHPP